MLFVYYNFVRIHSSIKAALAEKAGVIKYWGQDTERKRRLFLIEQGSGMPVSSLTIFIIVFWGRAEPSRKAVHF